MTLKIYTERKSGIISKEAKALKVGDVLEVTELTFPKGFKVVHLEKQVTEPSFDGGSVQEGEDPPS